MRPTTVIADDLTGACDTGVQLAKRGIDTSVLLDVSSLAESGPAARACVLDTDSRFLEGEDAYNRVYSVCKLLQARQAAQFVYKKIDSTLRGNIGAEIDAVYDALRPDLVCLAPAYPGNGRAVVGGRVLLHGVPLERTEVSRDPRTPVTESYIPALLSSRSGRDAAMITLEQVRSGTPILLAQLARLHRQGTAYVLFDAETADDMQGIAELLQAAAAYNIVWCGSAGLAEYIPGLPPPTPPPKLAPADTGRPCAARILTVVGSVSGRSRVQLERLLAEPDSGGVQLQAERLGGPAEETEREAGRIVKLALDEIAQGKHPVVYSSLPSPADDAQAGSGNTGVPASGLGSRVSAVLGAAAAEIVWRGGIDGLVLTGGDTARQVCKQLGVQELRLLRELEGGVPISRIAGERELRAVTKAGNFGSDDVLVRAGRSLQGRDEP